MQSPNKAETINADRILIYIFPSDVLICKNAKLEWNISGIKPSFYRQRAKGGVVHCQEAGRVAQCKVIWEGAGNFIAGEFVISLKLNIMHILVVTIKVVFPSHSYAYLWAAHSGASQQRCKEWDGFPVEQNINYIIQFRTFERVALFCLQSWLKQSDIDAKVWKANTKTVTATNNTEWKRN